MKHQPKFDAHLGDDRVSIVGLDEFLDLARTGSLNVVASNKVRGEVVFC